LVCLMALFWVCRQPWLCPSPQQQIHLYCNLSRPC
jgi:hypothetical protein